MHRLEMLRKSWLNQIVNLQKVCIDFSILVFKLLPGVIIHSEKPSHYRNSQRDRIGEDNSAHNEFRHTKASSDHTSIRIPQIRCLSRLTYYKAV